MFQVQHQRDAVRLRYQDARRRDWYIAGNGATLSPDQARVLAFALNQAADAAQNQSHWVTVSVEK
ncbi:hypothetical protein LCGC14_2113820 [marine sediment metagenome]|uniref:Uncharacterized protein n=1 Tax=marine sediment metagenome TaxID=412755 RepID=A0A0F9H2J5_9ZZZZ